jgi:phosphatidylglycerol:prolipoprotein diacylglycerol transferase
VRAPARPLATVYIVMLYLGCVAGTLSGAAFARAEGLDDTRFAIATVVLLVPAFAGARLLYLAQHLDELRADPGRLWRRGEGGAALYGGLGLALVVSVPALALAGLSFWSFWDAASVTMLVGLIFTRFGCLARGCCAGRPTRRGLGMRLRGPDGHAVRRVPTQLLEAALAAAILVVAVLTRARSPFAGATFAGVVAAYAAGRMLLEPTRESWRWQNVAISACLVLAGIAVLLAGALG